MKSNSTIAALATAPVPAGIAVVRISGPKTKTVLKALFRARQSPIAKRRELVFGEIIDFQTGEVIDRAMAVYMPGPHSFTGEDIGEFQVHGSPILVQKILRSLFAFGVEAAEPGEFTKRAFLNGKIDLSQAEAIADLINASSERALSIAGEHLKGDLRYALDRLGEPLRNALAEIEAGLDFPDEDISPKRLSEISATITSATLTIQQMLNTSDYGKRVREGFHVLLCGPPNAGKSSLLNLMLGKDRAIVTPISGTTRDLIEEDVFINGYKFVFCDSAGIRETSDEIEKIGIELAVGRVSWADLVLLVIDSNTSSEMLEQAIKLVHPKSRKSWLIVNKIDLNPAAIGGLISAPKTCANNFYISAKTRAGLDSLKDALIEELKASLPSQADSSAIVTNERQIACLSRAKDSLERATTAIAQKVSPELISAEIRLALSALEELVGKTYTEDILSRIFSKFCIGK